MANINNTPVRSLFVCDNDSSDSDDELDAATLTRNQTRAVGRVSGREKSTADSLQLGMGSTSPATKRLRPELATPGTALINRNAVLQDEDEIEPTQLATPAYFSTSFTQLEPSTETQEALVADGLAIPSPPPAFPALQDDSPHVTIAKPGAVPMDEWSSLVKSFFDRIDKRSLLTTTVSPTVKI